MFTGIVSRFFSFPGGVTGTFATVIGNKRASYYHETMNAIDTMLTQPNTTADTRSFLNRMKADVQQSGLNIDKNAAQELQQKIKNALPDTRQMQNQQDLTAQNRETPVTDHANTAKTINLTPLQVEHNVQSGIQANIQAKPEVVQKALIEGMTALDRIEIRIKAESKLASHEGIGLKSIHDMYMEYVENKVGIGVITPSMAEGIKAVMSAQALTETETRQLMGVLAEIVGDARLAEAYVKGINASMQGLLAEIDSEQSVGDNKVERIEGYKDATRNIVDTRGKRNDRPLTKEQYDELVTHATEFGFPEENIAPYNPNCPFETGLAYGNRLYINNDALPSILSNGNPNSLISGRGAMAHEIIGHYETIKKGTAFETQYYDLSGTVKIDSYNLALDEAQASIRAGRFAPGLTDSERITLIKDGLMRLKEQGLTIKEVRRLLDILER